MKRTPRNYSGTEITNQQVKDLLPEILNSLSKKVEEKPIAVISAWPSLVGERIAAMTKAVSFESGVLKVLVKNSTLYSLLFQHERERLINELRKKFPTLKIRNILFKIGDCAIFKKI